MLWDDVSLSHDTPVAHVDMQNLLASPRFKFAGGVRVTVKTALVKMTNTVAVVAERRVIMVALG